MTGLSCPVGSCHSYHRPQAVHPRHILGLLLLPDLLSHAPFMLSPDELAKFCPADKKKWTDLFDFAYTVVSTHRVTVRLPASLEGERKVSATKPFCPLGQEVGVFCFGVNSLRITVVSLTIRRGHT